MTFVYKKLPVQEQRAIAKQLTSRRAAFENLIYAQKGPAHPVILMVGDRPGPGAPNTDSFHHTPFYSIYNSSGWLNVQLVREQIPEERLLWVNSADRHDKDTDPTTIFNFVNVATAVALGSNAAKWLKTLDFEKFRQPQNSSYRVIQTYHPQYWKRWRSKERYPLLDILKELTAAEEIA